MTPPGNFVFSVNGGLDGCAEARRAIVALDGAVPDSAREDILLLVSELVSNAVRHSGVGPDRSLQVVLERRPGRVRVEVAHPGAVFERRPVPTSGDADGGWGLILVERIAERWGITSCTSGTCVWFELPADE